ncbi:MAG: cupin domain-containing protein [Firmicutes bacterium]|nr:cupin domain-containing protein [Bacillota bacterium]
MIKIRLEDLETQPTPLGGRSRFLVDNPDLRLVNLVLQPGESVAPHTAPVKVVFLALEGRGRMVLEEKEVEISAGELAVCPPGVDRAVRAEGGSGLSLLVIRCPNR